MLPFELIGKVISFIGGVVLTYDALTKKEQIQIETGVRAFQDLLENAGMGDRLKNYQGGPLREEKNLQIWLSGRSLVLARVGIVLMTVGFLLELFAYFMPKP